MCEWCKDLRNVEPACYIGAKGPKLKAWLEEHHRLKHFICIDYSNPDVPCLFHIQQCPVCHHVFTEEDYEEYLY